MTKRIRGVAIGAGYFSQFHFEAWSRIKSVEMCAVCDIDRGRADVVARDHEIKNVYDDIDTMFDVEQPDFVDIITRPDSHLELVRAAASRAIPIIVQKPLATSFVEASAIVEEARKANVPLMVHENFRFQPWYREIKRLVDLNRIGDQLHSIMIRTRTGDGWQPDAYLARQPYFREMERFLVFETGVHFIDVFRFLAGDVNTVFALLRRLNASIAGEDAGLIVLQHAQGATCVWDANRFNESNAEDPRFTFGEMLVEGNGGSIRLFPDGRITIQPLGGKEFVHEYNCPRRNFAGDCVHATQEHFVERLLAGEPFETRGDEYLKSLEVQEAVYHSASTGQVVRDFS